MHYLHFLHFSPRGKVQKVQIVQCAFRVQASPAQGKSAESADCAVCSGGGVQARTSPRGLSAKNGQKTGDFRGARISPHAPRKTPEKGPF